MNYNKIYESLIERGKNRTLHGYSEVHHIVPRCMNGSDSEDNLVKLTPEEHYLAHQLLIKIYPNNHSLVKAAIMMMPNRPSNKMYGWLRRKFSQVQSESQRGKSNSQYNTLWITDGKLNKKIKIGEKIPKGWEKGRTIKNPPFFSKIEQCKDCLSRQNAIYWFERFKHSNASSIREFVRNSDYDKSHVSFIKMLKKHIPEFKTAHGKKYIPV